MKLAGQWWLTPIILGIWEAEIGRITVPDQLQIKKKLGLVKQLSSQLQQEI
jgi:hypothetical protein